MNWGRQQGRALEGLPQGSTITSIKPREPTLTGSLTHPQVWPRLPLSWKIDPSHTLIEFSVRHMMIAKVRGRFESFDGTVHLDAENPAASWIEGTIDVDSIDTKDEQRDAHLRSADFFEVDNYPKMHFRSTRIEALGAGQYKVYGDLTIKDVTQEVVFNVADEGQAQDPWGNQRWGVSASTKINRKDFGLSWNVALETGGWLVGEQVTISAEVELVQEQPEPEVAVAEQ